MSLSTIGIMTSLATKPNGSVQQTNPLGSSILTKVISPNAWLSTTNPNLAFGTSNFTYEAWIKPTNNPAYGLINWGPYANLANNNRLTIFVNYPGQKRNALTVQSMIGSAAFQTLASTNLISVNAWTHVAVVKNGSSVTIYINGVASGTSTNMTINCTIADCVQFKTYTDYNQEYYPGYATGIRLSNIARYTGNFVPSKKNFTPDQYTLILMNSLTDEAPNPSVWTNNNGCTTNTENFPT